MKRNEEKVTAVILRTLGEDHSLDNINCRLTRGFGGIQIAMFQVPKDIAEKYTTIGKIRIRFINCGIR